MAPASDCRQWSWIGARPSSTVCSSCDALRFQEPRWPIRQSAGTGYCAVHNISTHPVMNKPKRLSLSARTDRSVQPSTGAEAREGHYPHFN
ncbi:protein of unknown function [Aminobacter niigataensis]|nr:protein of unknown function [Aminobacter niigataensis]